jgi:uncharacterized protein
VARLAVISDTHFPSRGPDLPAACVAALTAADMIVHAGDICDLATLSMLRQLGPVVAVRGNMDDEQVSDLLGQVAIVEMEGVTLAVVHDGGPEAGRLQRMRRRFPEADGIVFGHSHVPAHVVADDGVFILNPGSPTDRRRQPRHSMAEIEIEGGAVIDVRFLAVDEPPGPLDPALVRTGPV